MVPSRIRGVPGMLIDVTQLLRRRDKGPAPRGIDRVSLEYIRRYAAQARAVLSLGPFAGALSRADSLRVFEWLLQPVSPFESAGLVLKSMLSGWIRPRTGDSFLLNLEYLWYSTALYAAQLRLLGARPVFFVHDLIPLTHPELCPAEDARRAHGQIRDVLRIARGIVVNSRDTELVLKQYAERAGLAVPPVAVAPLAPALGRADSPGPWPDDGPYFVVVGTIEPRKNQAFLLEVWRELLASGPRPVPKLHVVGGRGYGSAKFLKARRDSGALQWFVVESNRCSDDEVARLLRHACALLMPTLAEGFGMPVAEALAAGVPVIASDLPVFREFAGEIPEYADPKDAKRWAELVLDYARPDGARRAAQLERMKGFRPTTWDDHFRIVERFLESLP